MHLLLYTKSNLRFNFLEMWEMINTGQQNGLKIRYYTPVKLRPVRIYSNVWQLVLPSMYTRYTVSTHLAWINTCNGQHAIDRLQLFGHPNCFIVCHTYSLCVYTVTRVRMHTTIKSENPANPLACIAVFVGPKYAVIKYTCVILFYKHILPTITISWYQ